MRRKVAKVAVEWDWVDGNGYWAGEGNERESFVFDWIKARAFIKAFLSVVLKVIDQIFTKKKCEKGLNFFLPESLAFSPLYQNSKAPF